MSSVSGNPDGFVAVFTLVSNTVPNRFEAGNRFGCIHIVPIRYEYDRVVSPLREAGVDIVYLLFDEQVDHQPQYYDYVEADLTEMGLVHGKTLYTLSCDQSDPYVIFGLVTTITAEHPDACVDFDLATESKLAPIGAALGCMDAETDATRTPHAANYRHEGISTPVTSGYTGATELIDHSIESHTQGQFTDLATESRELNWSNNLSSSEQVSAYTRLGTNAVQPLDAKGLYDDKRGRSSY